MSTEQVSVRTGYPIDERLLSDRHSVGMPISDVVVQCATKVWHIGHMSWY